MGETPQLLGKSRKKTQDNQAKPFSDFPILSPTATASG